MKRCSLIIPDAGPINSLWVADQLSLLLKLDMAIILVDAVYDELTSDPENWLKDFEVKKFVEGHMPPFVIESTGTGLDARSKRVRGEKLRKNVGDVAIADFMSDGIEKYVSKSDPVVILFEDKDISQVQFLRRPRNLHLLSTVGFLRGLESVKIIPSADEIINEMLNPTRPDRRPRFLTDQPSGIDIPAQVGNVWTPIKPK